MQIEILHKKEQPQNFNLNLKGLDLHCNPQGFYIFPLNQWILPRNFCMPFYQGQLEEQS